MERIADISIAPKEYQLYWFRWVVALLLCVSSAMSSFILATFIAIWFVAVDFFATDNLGINMFSMVYMIFFLPSSLLSIFWTERFGVGSAIAFGALMNFLCCWMRVGGSYHSDPYSSYSIVIAGQCIAAFGQPFLLNAPPRIANDWFPVHERDYIMHVMTQANNIGGALGTIIPAYQVFVDVDGSYDRNDISRMLIWQGVASTGLLILSLLFVRSRPPTPPTADVEIQLKLRKEVDTAAALKTVFQMLRDFGTMLQHFNFNILLASFSCILGVSWAFMAVVGQMVYPCGYDTVATGWAGFSLSFAGVAGSFFISQILRFYKDYVHVTKAVIVLCCATGIWCLGVNSPGSVALLIAAWNSFGFFTGPLIPVVLEFATEMTFPIPGDNSAALLFTGVNWVALSLTLGLSPLLGYPESMDCATIMSPAAALVLTFLLLGALLSVFLRKDYKRLESVNMVRIAGDEEELMKPSVDGAEDKYPATAIREE